MGKHGVGGEALWADEDRQENCYKDEPKAQDVTPSDAFSALKEGFYLRTSRLVAIDWKEMLAGRRGWATQNATLRNKGTARHHMQVRVLFFGILKDVAGRATDSVALPDGASVAELIQHYEQRLPRLRALFSSIAISVNQEYANPEVELKDGDEVALLPPVSGGLATERVRLVREKIDTQALLEEIKRPEDGAAIVFEGVVRNNTRGRKTLYLDYEAYEEMALKRLQGLLDQARSEFKIRDAAIVHRLGKLQIGEASVLIVVASAHRAVAFEACRWLIDTLKKTVPIWKKEHFEDGAVWADGEPFPDEIPRAGTSFAERPASK